MFVCGNSIVNIYVYIESEVKYIIMIIYDIHILI